VAYGNPALQPINTNSRILESALRHQVARIGAPPVAIAAIALDEPAVYELPPQVRMITRQPIALLIIEVQRPRLAYDWRYNSGLPLLFTLRGCWSVYAPPLSQRVVVLPEG
jgi:hypothetical protein